jgi:hypothetical protein
MTNTPPTLLDRPHAFQDLFDRMHAVLRRIDGEFPELDSEEELSGADAVDRITEIRAEAKAMLAAVQQFNTSGS